LEKSIDQLIQLESSNKVPVLYNLPQIELARIVCEWTGESFDPRNFEKYVQSYAEARARFTEARRLDDLKKEAERLKKDEALKDKVLDLLKVHLVAEDHKGKTFPLDGDYELSPVETSGTYLHYKDGGPVIDALPKLSCKFRGTKYKVRDLISEHLDVLVQQLNAGQIPFSIVALSQKLLAETVRFHCTVVNQSDCPNHWRNRLNCGSATLKFRPK
jgi:hypothetical protein